MEPAVWGRGGWCVEKKVSNFGQKINLSDRKQIENTESSFLNRLFFLQTVIALTTFENDDFFQGHLRTAPAPLAWLLWHRLPSAEAAGRQAAGGEGPSGGSSTKRFASCAPRNLPASSWLTLFYASSSGPGFFPNPSRIGLRGGDTLTCSICISFPYSLGYL